MSRNILKKFELFPDDFGGFQDKSRARLFPKERAAEIAVRTVTEWLAAHPGKMERVIFNVFSDRDRNIYEQLFR